VTFFVMTLALAATVAVANVALVGCAQEAPPKPAASNPVAESQEPSTPASDRWELA
jgi:hypothetical protein